jgi:hypothetical protein
LQTTCSCSFTLSCKPMFLLFHSPCKQHVTSFCQLQISLQKSSE